jgi:hypothetical protein
MGKAWSMCFACWRGNHDQHRDRRRQQCRSGDPENAQCSRLLHLRRCPGTQSDFKKEGAVWREYAPDAVASNYEFEEVRRTRDEILLRDLTPREGVADSASLVVHLPVCGGTAKLTEALPERWTDLEEVWRASRRG